MALLGLGREIDHEMRLADMFPFHGRATPTGADRPSDGHGGRAGLPVPDFDHRILAGKLKPAQDPEGF